MGRQVAFLLQQICGRENVIMHDDWFIRGHVPMTKREVRAVSIDALDLTDNSLLLDVGAGTGSVSVESAMLYPGIPVFAMEKNPEALALIRANAEKAQTDAVEMVDLLRSRGESSFSLDHTSPNNTSSFSSANFGASLPR